MANQQDSLKEKWKSSGATDIAFNTMQILTL